MKMKSIMYFLLHPLFSYFNINKKLYESAAAVAYFFFFVIVLNIEL